MRQKLKAGILLFLLSIFFTIPAHAEETDAWLSDWKYSVYSSIPTNPIIRIKGYKGTSPEAHIYGRATIDGVSYKVYVWGYEKTEGGVSRYISSFNNTETTDIEELYFHAVDGQPVVAQNGNYVEGLFWGMPNLKAIHFGDGLDFTSVKYVRWLFYGDTSLKEADCENLDLSTILIADHMFEGAGGLESVTVDMPMANSFLDMFKDCTSLKSVHISTNTPNPSYIYMKEMYKGCTSLKDVRMEGFNLAGTSNTHTGMFNMCKSLEGFDFSMLDMSKATDCSYMFCGCNSLKSLDLTTTSWNPEGVDLTGIVESCPSFTEMTVDPDLIVSDVTQDIGYIPDPVKLTIIGETSESFDKNVIGKLKTTNRYLQAIDVKASIELTGDESHDTWSYGLKVSGDNRVKIKEGTGGSTVYFNAVPYRLFLYEPREYTLTLTQGNTVFDFITGFDKVEAVTETEDGFRCETNPLTKKIEMTRNEDGSIDIEEI